jgi:hypothetical protein
LSLTTYRYDLRSDGGREAIDTIAADVDSSSLAIAAGTRVMASTVVTF